MAPGAQRMESSHLARAICEGFLQEVVADPEELVCFERRRWGKCKGRRHKLYCARKWLGILSDRF